MKELSDQQLTLLKKPLPDKAVSQHPTKSYLSSIKAIYVTERLTEVFSVGGWRTKVEEISCNTTNGMVVVKVTLEVPEYNIYYECYGGNDNGGSANKNFDLGDAYKGATTDAITKIGSYLGIAIDVFKGETTAPKSDKRNVDVWMSQNIFDQVIADKQKASKALVYYDNKTEQEDGKVYGMKKEYREKLNAKK